MNTYADKTQENKNRSITNSAYQKQRNDDSKFQFEDNRPQVSAVRKLQEATNNSPQIIQQKVLQEKVNNRNPIIQMKGKINVNNDANLEKEADIMGAKALNTGKFSESSQEINQTIFESSIQKKGTTTVAQLSSLTDTASDGPFDSPYKKLKTELNGANLFLTSQHGQAIDPSSTKSSYKRPKTVTSQIVGPRRSSGTRPPSSVPSSVGNLGDQENLIRKGIRSKTFQGGHLIGDELLDASVDSMVDWNLAPQNSSFNHPVYFGLAEEMIFGGALDPITNLPNRSIPIDVQVDLGYPGSEYKVTVKDLINHGIVSSVEMAQKRIPNTKSIKFPNRVPTEWNIQAKPKRGTFPHREMTKNQLAAVDTSSGFNTPLGPTDFLVQSPDMYTAANGKHYIGGGKSLSLFGKQGDTTPTNAHSLTPGTMPTMSLPALAPPAMMFGHVENVNQVLLNHGGVFPTYAINTLKSTSPGISKTHIKRLNNRLKRRYRNQTGGVNKLFKNRRQFDDFIYSTIPKTKSGRALILRLRMEVGLRF